MPGGQGPSTPTDDEAPPAAPLPPPKQDAERERERLRARLHGKIAGGESHKKAQAKPKK